MNQEVTNRLKQILAQENYTNQPCSEKTSEMSAEEEAVFQEKRNACLEMLEKIVDCQATEEEQQAFLEHTKQCMPCYKEYKLEAAIKEMLMQKLEKKSLPCDLIDCVKSKIKETQI
ncbi:hypothetical protein SAMN05421780_10884 [Flexibacter flexilis DSM 6793]|uniref:Mycothiol system anti-sigma-R factor n=1 Tax=Flexibacter flexilis DSM 6793 TaxID=927664 RepID=A0A1I1L7V2_9BACT|nr:hypothetical protein [Flexibacter flexilis]SFC68582.1 hypothetical protein SAMN05421780_10884 [Flexibacter flexilis DSM 6793]